LSKRVHQTTNSLKGFKGFEIDPTTGFPICPKTRELINGTRSYCKSCFTFGHSQRSFTGCVIVKDHLLDVKNIRIFKGKGVMIAITNKIDN